jgi:hypothetical protein
LARKSRTRMLQPMEIGSDLIVDSAV